MATHNQRKPTTPSFSLKGLNPTSGILTASESQAPQTFSFETRWACVHNTHKAIVNWETVLKGSGGLAVAMHQGLAQRQLPEMPQSSCDRDLFTPLRHRFEGAGIQPSKQPGPYRNTRKNPRGPAHTAPSLHSALLQGTSISQKGACAHSWYPASCGCCAGGAPWLPVLVVSRAYIPRSPQDCNIREAVLHQPLQEHSTQREDWKAPPIFLERGLFAYFKASSWGTGC